MNIVVNLSNFSITLPHTSNSFVICSIFSTLACVFSDESLHFCHYTQCSCHKYKCNLKGNSSTERGNFLVFSLTDILSLHTYVHSKGSLAIRSPMKNSGENISKISLLIQLMVPFSLLRSLGQDVRSSPARWCFLSVNEHLANMESICL